MVRGTGVVSSDTHEAFLDRVYEAAIDPRLWTDVIEQTADLLGGTEANLIDQDEMTCEGRAIYARSDPAAIPLYFQHYIRCSPLLRTEAPRAPRILTDEDKLPKRELIRTEYYNDFLRKFDCHSILIVRLAVCGSRSVAVNLVRPANREPFGRRDLETASRLHPHLIRAYNLSSKLFGIRTWESGAGKFLEDSMMALFLVGADGKVQRSNPAAEALLAGSSDLTSRNGVLRGASSEVTRKLHALIAAACEPDVGRRSAGSMPLPRDDRGPLSVTATPFGGEQAEFLLAELTSGRSALLCVSDPYSDAAVPEQRLQDLFGLSRAEARVARQLLEGRVPREAAKKLGVSFYTVRGHLVRMYQKTGVNRQAELVRMMTRALGRLPG
jgi:DNA-binding CsgD family transcriptional regulator